MQSKTPVKILLVDDEPANLLALEVVLAPLGATLVSAGSGQEALKEVLSADFAAILLDVRMPGMSGFEVASMIRDRQKSSNTPILFLTAYDDSGRMIEEAYSLGAVDFLTKPINPIVVRAKVGFFVELYRKTEELRELQEQRHAALLDAKEERIRLILDNAREYAFIGTDPTGLITEWQAGAVEITGWNAQDVIGKSLSLIYTPEDRTAKRFDAALADARAKGSVYDKRWHQGRGGKAFYADGVVIPLHDRAGSLQGFAKIFRDTTVEHEAAEKANRTVALLHESEERLRLATAAGGLGVWTWFPESDVMNWEVDSHRALGHALEVPPATLQALLGLINTDDAALLRKQSPRRWHRAMPFTSRDAF